MNSVVLFALHRIRQDVVKVAPVNHHVRRPIPRDGFRAKIEQTPLLARVPQSNLFPLRLARYVVQLLSKSKFE